MTINKYIFFIPLLAFMLFVQILGTRVENANVKISTNFSRTFNPFVVNSWFSYPSQALQYWFPLFRPAFYPPSLLRPSTSKPPTVNQTEIPADKSKPKTDNIFGISGPPDDNIGCLSPDEIEW